MVFSAQRIDPDVLQWFHVANFESDGAPFSSEEQFVELAAAATGEEPVQDLAWRPTAMRIARPGGVNLFNNNFERMMEVNRMLVDATESNDQLCVRSVGALLRDLVDRANAMVGAPSHPNE